MLSVQRNQWLLRTRKLCQQKKHKSHTETLPAFTSLEEIGYLSRNSQEKNMLVCWGCTPSSPLCQPVSATGSPSHPHPWGRNQRISKSRTMLLLSLSLCADTPGSHGGVGFFGLGEPRLLWRCFAWNELHKDQNALWHSRAEQADTCDRAGELSKKGHVFYRLSSDLNGTSVSDAKRHHSPSTPRSQLPTYISICQLSSSCSVPVKSPGFSPFSVIMLNCWDQILVTLELPNNPLLFFISFHSLLLINVSQCRAQHRHSALHLPSSSRVQEGLPASSELSPDGELRFFIAETPLRHTEGSRLLTKRSYRHHIFESCLKPSPAVYENGQVDSAQPSTLSPRPDSCVCLQKSLGTGQTHSNCLGCFDGPQ